MTVILNIEYLQFKDEDHFILIFKGVVKVDQFAVMEMVHDVDLFPDQSLLHGVSNWDELGSEDMLCFQFSASVDNSESSGSDLFQDLVVIVHAVLGLDLHRLGDVLGVDVEDELVVVSDLAFLATDLLAGVRINCKDRDRKVGLILMIFLKLTLVLSSGSFLLQNSLGGDQGALVAGHGPAVDVLSEHPEPVLVAGDEAGDGDQGEPGVADPAPAGHGQLLLLHHVVGDGGSSVPGGDLPLQHQAVRADLAGLGPPGRVGAV